MVTLDSVSTSWRRALHAADEALDAAGECLTAAELGPHRSRIVSERQSVQEILDELAVHDHERLHHRLTEPLATVRSLGLPDSIRGCVFDLDGVLPRLAHEGVVAYGDPGRYLESAQEAGLPSAVVSASSNTAAILDRAGLTPFVAARVDGEAIEARDLRPKPAPDMLVVACASLGVAPDRTAAFETTVAGVVAARAAGVAFVIGVAYEGGADELLAHGADVTVVDLADLLAATRPRAGSSASRR